MFVPDSSDEEDDECYEDGKEEHRLTSEEQERCRQLFNAFDKDDNGYIDQSELKTVLKLMGHRDLRSKDIKAVFRSADRENLGHINFSQFKRIVAAQKQNACIRNEADTLDAFIAMGGDPSGEGYIDASRMI